MDYVFGPEPSITIRTIGGILDFFMFLGPSPEQVTQQYTWLIGRPMMPPYWSLGFQLSRWGYGNLTHMREVNQRNRDAGVPFDVQFADIDYMDHNKDFTVDPINYQGLKEFFNELHADGMRTIIILDPGTFDDQKYYNPTVEGMKQDVYVKWENEEPMKGACWPGELFIPGKRIIFFK
jgi:maltase-glucoamylase